MAAPTLRDLLTPPLLDDLRDDAFARLKNPAFPITDWNVGAVVRTLIELDALSAFELVGAGKSTEIMALRAFADTSESPSLGDVARCLYELVQTLPALAFQTVMLSCAAGYGPYTIASERLTFVNPAGQFWVNTTGGSLTGGGTLNVTARGEAPGASQGLVTALKRPLLPGVTVTSAVVFDSGSDPNHGFGANGETDVSLIARCLARWVDLTAIPTQDRVTGWAIASDTRITRVRLDPDLVNAGGVIITVASSTGPVASGAVTAAQAYIDLRAPVIDFPTAQNAVARNITPTAGTVTVAAGQLAAAQLGSDAAWTAFLGGAPIGARVPWSVLEAFVMDQTGVIDVVGLELNSGGAETDVVLAANEVPVKVGTLASQLTWVGV